MISNYLTVLEESLRQKLQVLAEIQEYNLQQENIFGSDNVDMSKFDEYVDRKGELIDKLTGLDRGFERLYVKVSAELKGNQEKYAEQIMTLQHLISRITEESITVQAQEARNKKLIEDYFKREKEGIRKNRVSSKVAYDYYKSMSKSSVVMPQFMDSKK